MKFNPGVVLTLNLVHMTDSLDCKFVYKGVSLSSLSSLYESKSFIFTSIRFLGFKLTLLLAYICEKNSLALISDPLISPTLLLYL